MREKPPANKFFWDRSDLQEGDPFLLPEPRRRKGHYVEAACREARGLPAGEDCYELRLFRLFRDEYVAGLPEVRASGARYREDAALVLRAIERLPAGMNHEVYLSIYENMVTPIVSLILDGNWDEAYETYNRMHDDLKTRFLEDGRRAG